jgi:nucleoid DNA-binding protein
MPGALNKQVLIKAIVARTGLSQADARKVLEIIIKEITRALANGENVSVPAFGTFSVRTRAARSGRNPRTGEMLRIPAGRQVKFSNAKALKEAANAEPAGGSSAEFRVGSKRRMKRERPDALAGGGRPVPKTARRKPNIPEPASDEPRYLQAQLEQETGGNFSNVTAFDTLAKSRKTRANVRIGYPSQQWASASRPVEFEDKQKKPRLLDLFFWEAGNSSAPQKKSIELPVSGTSSTASFCFTPGPESDVLEARITLVYQGRVLQTGSLEAKFGESDEGCGLRFRLDGALEPNLDSSADREAFDLALVFNHSANGQKRAFSFSEGDSAVIDIREDDVDRLTSKLNAILSRIADEPEVYSDLGSEDSRKLFRDLAQRGATLRKEVIGSSPGKVKSGRRLQIVSTRGSYLPAEFLYDFEAPDDDAQLCDGFEAALSSGPCCGACETNPDKNICPLGFWALSTVIERHARTRDPGDLRDGAFRFLVRNAEQREPLPVLKSALLGASDRADSKDPTAVSSLYDVLSGLYSGQALPPVIRDWNEWSAAIKSARRSLLVLLPHHYSKEGFEILEIGKDAGLKADVVKTKHVSFDDDSAPIVLLIGCVTSFGRISFDSFIRRFHEAGASVVIGTVSTILGRHAGPASEILIRQIIEAAKSGDGTMGKAMLSARRKLVGQGFPMSMGLSAYGGADWKLEAGGD